MGERATNVDEFATLRKGLADYLRKHGYGFQYAALREAKQAFEADKSRWAFEVAELPVEVQGRATRIDFILTTNKGQVLMLVECKRANPSLKNWLFLKAPYVRRDSEIDYYLAEHLNLTKIEGAPKALEDYLKARCLRLRPFGDSEPVCHLAVELATKELGEGPPRGAIAESADQAIKGMNGLVELISANTRLLKPKMDTKMTILLPVIFTTAKLFTCDADLSETDLLSGNVDLSKAGFQARDYVFLQHPVSSSFQHGAHNPKPDTLSAQLETEFLRTVPIVTASGIKGFLRAMDPETYSMTFPPTYERSEEE